MVKDGTKSGVNISESGSVSGNVAGFGDYLVGDYLGIPSPAGEKAIDKSEWKEKSKMDKIPLLTSEDIEIKIKQVTKSGALALAYKTARVDRRILDGLVGPLNWTVDYKLIDETLFCGIGVRENSSEPFVYKWDCGVESRSDDDGNEKKGQASDAEKRAGFQWGIGVELYSSPLIWLDVETTNDGGSWHLKNRYANYVVTHIAYNEDTRVITELEICNADSNVRVFSWKMPTTGAMAKKMVKTLSSEPVVKSKQETGISVGKVDPVVESLIEEEAPVLSPKEPLSVLISEIGKEVKAMYLSEGNSEKYNQIVKKVTGGTSFKCNTATEKDYDTVLAIHDMLLKGGEENG